MRSLKTAGRKPKRRRAPRGLGAGDRRLEGGNESFSRAELRGGRKFDCPKSCAPGVVWESGMGRLDLQTRETGASIRMLALPVWVNSQWLRASIRASGSFFLCMPKKLRACGQNVESRKCCLLVRVGAVKRGPADGCATSASLARAMVEPPEVGTPTGWLCIWSSVWTEAGAR
jgi:hypothetical protein